MNEIGKDRQLFPLGLFGHNWAWYEEQEIKSKLATLRDGFDGDYEVVEYLRNGAIISAPMEGMTRDVISGERHWVLAGNSILTDGTFFWRGDTADYVETYQVGLRHEFMIHGLLNEWSYNLLPEAFLLQRVLSEADYASTYDAIIDFLRGESPAAGIDGAMDGDLKPLNT